MVEKKLIDIGDPIIDILVKMLLGQFKQFDHHRNFDEKHEKFLTEHVDFALELEELMELNIIFDYVLDIIGFPEDESYPHIWPEDDLYFDDDGHPCFDENSLPDGFCRDCFYDELMSIESSFVYDGSDFNLEEEEEKRRVTAKRTIHELIELRDKVFEYIKECEDNHKKYVTMDVINERLEELGNNKK